MPHTPSYTTLYHEAKDYIVIALGLLGYAIAFTCLQLPHQIPSGGVAGAGAIIFYATNFPAQYTYIIVNGFLLIAAIKVLGWRFCLKTIYAVFMLTFLLGVIKNACLDYAALHPEVAVSKQGMPIFLGDAFMSCVLGSGIQGCCIGYVFLHQGSTGGTDIIAAMVNKYRDVSLGQIMMLCDLLIITSSLLIPGFTISNLLYGYCTLMITSVMLDYVVDKGRESVQFFIFSNKYEEIGSAINATGRGVTMLRGQGWYTKADRMVLVVMARKRESAHIFRIIKTIDPGAFVSQSKVIGVFGYGFDRIKVRAAKNESELQQVENIHAADIAALHDQAKPNDLARAGL